MRELALALRSLYVACKQSFHAPRLSNVKLRVASSYIALTLRRQ